MKLYLPSGNDGFATIKLMICGAENNSSAYLPLDDVAERMARGERFLVPDPFDAAGRPHLLRCCERQELRRPATFRFLVLSVKDKEMRRGGMAGCGGAWLHSLPLLDTENVLCIAKRNGIYRWRRAAETICNVAVLNRQDRIVFAHTEQRALGQVTDRGAFVAYCLSVEDDAPCVFSDDYVRFIMADKAPVPPRDERLLGFVGERRFYLRPELNDAPLNHLIRMGRVPMEGGEDAEARELFTTCFEEMAARGYLTVGSVPPADAEKVFYAIAPWRHAALAVDAQGRCLAYARDGGDIRPFHSLLLLAACRRGERICCADLPRFLHQRKQELLLR